MEDNSPKATPSPLLGAVSIQPPQRRLKLTHEERKNIAYDIARAEDDIIQMEKKIKSLDNFIRPLPIRVFLDDSEVNFYVKDDADIIMFKSMFAEVAKRDMASMREKINYKISQLNADLDERKGERV